MNKPQLKEDCMIYDVSVTIRPEEEKEQAIIKEYIMKELYKKDRNLKESDITEILFRKKSIDARKGQIKFHLKYSVGIGEKVSEAEAFRPKWKKASEDKSVIIVGSGPAGLFAALKLLEYGIKPVIIERGSVTQERKQDIADISTKNIINENSNYCFGEGGAGTFSDGKLYTRSNKRGDISSILKIFHYHGAGDAILTDAHPHIGSDKLPKIINGIRKTITDFGGEFHFNTKCINLLTDDSKTVKGIEALNLKDNSIKKLYADKVMIATGHSAKDIYEMIYRQGGNKALEAKTFAIGVRVEHSRNTIDKIQYHGKERGKILPAAEYRLTTQVDERGVYSFCMCPGGLVVPSASGENEIVVNGMSPSSRNSAWSNAAIVVETRFEDIPEEFSDGENDVLAGLKFRTFIENSAYKQTNCQKAPAQLLKDFMNGKKSKNLPDSSYTPGLVSSNLSEWLPKQITYRLKEAFTFFNRNMHGFISDEALLIAPETRTSTPVRILRDKESGENPVLKNLYPAGEGSGYSGGIVSSAMDGENIAMCIVNNLLK